MLCTYFVFCVYWRDEQKGCSAFWRGLVLVGGIETHHSDATKSNQLIKIILLLSLHFHKDEHPSLQDSTAS